MIKNEELEFLQLKEPRIDFLEEEGQEELPPSRRKLVRIAEQAQIYTAQDIYNERAILIRDIAKGKQDLEPKIFKVKVQNLKSAMEAQIKEKERQLKMLDDEIQAFEAALDIEWKDKEFNIALHEKLKEEDNK